MKMTGSAVWSGGLKDGSGTISTGSGALTDAPYGYRARFEQGPGTNPEELIGAAHAGCFAMALSLMLGEAGLPPEHLAVQAEITLDQLDSGYAITASHLHVRARIPGADEAQFQELAERATAGCPVSKLLNAKITMEAQLER